MPNTALHDAVKEGNLNMVRHRVRKNNINTKDEDDMTALYLASSEGNTEVVKLLLTFNPDVNIPYVDGTSALIVAALCGHTEIVKALLMVDGINVNHTSNDNETAIWIAACNGYPEIVHALVAAGADLSIASKNGKNPIDVAKTEEIKEIIRNPAPYTFCYAAGAGNLIEVQSLVGTINVNCLGTHGETATYKACATGHVDVVLFLASHGADVNIANSKGWFPVNVAAENRHLEVLQVLAANGANFGNVNSLGINGETSIYKACAAGHADIVQFLISQGADVNMKNIHCWSPINVAAERGHIEVLQVLAAHGADLDKSLLIIASKKNLDAVVVLFNFGADVSIKDSDGKTCLDQFSAKDKLTILTKIELNQSFLEDHNCALWFVIVQEDGTSDADLFAKLLVMVEALVSSNPSLADAKDANGRAAVDVASKPMKAIMQSILLWHGRYRITERRPEHISATCFVFKAIDENTIDTETSQPMKVALKLMRLKDQFQREILTRDKEFNQEHVMHILQTHPEVGSSTLDSWPDEVLDVETDATGQLTKAQAEKFYLLVMPLADRNLFVALKQERWAGKNMEEVRHVFVQLVHCVKHMHEKGVLHGDLKILNIVRTGGQFKLIDLDAACVIGKEPVGHKSSSAYVPPEAIYIDEKTDTACVRSVMAVKKGEATC